MFCPGCHAEYRQGITVCADCNYALVPVLDLPAEQEPMSDLLFESPSPVKYSAIMAALEKEKIPFQSNEQTGGFLYSSVNKPMHRVWIRPSDRERGNQVMDELFGPADEEPVELPAYDEPEGSLVGSGSPEDSRDSAESDVFPEDLTVAIWTGEDPTTADFVAMTLREHRIPALADVEDEETAPRVLVRAVDQERAREILKEIESSPMEGN